MEVDLQKEFCPRCYYLITHYSSSKFLNKEDILKLESNYNCNFCFGILDLNNYDELISKIKYEISNIDHTDFKLALNFTQIFEVIQFFWRIFFTNNPLIEKPSEIDIEMIKEIFRQLITTKLENSFHETLNLSSDLNIELQFDLDEEVYNDINNMFKYINKQNIKFKPNDFQKTKTLNIKNILKIFPQSLLIELFKKFGLNKLSNNPILKKNFVVLKDSTFLKGNYLKYTRNIGQSKWEINGVKVCPSSVEEEIAKMLKNIFISNEIILNAGGREDRDVRMLGCGRPFMIEIINPKKYYKGDVQNLQKIINENTNLIQVTNLDFTDRTYFSVVNKYATNKKKSYTCVAWVQKELNDEDIKKLNSVKDIKIIQKTPFRVMHRRTVMDREKEIYCLEAEKINEHFLKLTILSSAGTYIKEFVHSDLGRTRPSLNSLLNCECDILQLDVLDLILEN